MSTPAVTILAIVEARLNRTPITLADFAEAGFQMLGGCEICHATIGAYNAYPSRSGFWRCADCIGDSGWPTVQLAIAEIFDDQDGHTLAKELKNQPADRRQNRPPKLLETAQRCREVWEAAAAQNADLWGRSLIDLMADNLPAVSLADLKSAIVVAGIYTHVNSRLKAEIAGYAELIVPAVPR